MLRKQKRHFLKEKESKELLERATKRFKVDLKQILIEKNTVEIVETDLGTVCLANGKPLLFVIENLIYPTLLSKEFFQIAPRVIVDMGAVPFVCKGANIMAPGIRRFEGDFTKGDIVFVADEKHGKAIALGEAMYDIEDAKNIKKGTVVKNIHYVGDSIWQLSKYIDETK